MITMKEQTYLYCLHYQGKQIQRNEKKYGEISETKQVKKYVYFQEWQAKNAIKYLPSGINRKEVEIVKYVME